VSIVTVRSVPLGLVYLLRITYVTYLYHPVQTWGFVTVGQESVSAGVVMKEGHAKDVSFVSKSLL
jgi:hypothetical protein